MNRLRSIIRFAVAMLFVGIALPVFAQPADIGKIEHHLLPAVIAAGEAPRPMDLAERMAFHQVPGVSIAYFENGKIQWAKGYGLRDSTHAVDTLTLFQAASISKPVAATGALKLVEQGKLALDRPANDYLRSWKVPDTTFTDGAAVTLRRLVTHTAGLTVHGFGGYAAGKAVPTTVQVLDGSGPANSAPVRVDTVPGGKWRYSGGGYTVMQQMVEDVSGQPFADFMEQAVLQPAGMRHSTYRQPLPAAYQAGAASGHRGNGKAVAGNWHTYPEQAAAGLWTTPSDLARWAIAIQRAYSGESGQVLSPDMARQMFTKHLNDWGLGPALNGEGETLSFGHGGSNEGFKCQLFAFARPGGPGVAIMTNGDNGYKLVGELLRGFDQLYGWNKFTIDTIALVELSADQLDRFTGLYEFQPGFRARVTRDGNRLAVHRLWDDATLDLRPTADNRFFSFDDLIRVEFVPGENGKVEKMVVQGNTVLLRIEE